jgi:hypothetical protein
MLEEIAGTITAARGEQNGWRRILESGEKFIAAPFD